MSHLEFARIQTVADFYEVKRVMDINPTVHRCRIGKITLKAAR